MSPNDCNFILGFGVAGYRSFGPELQRIGPCRKINLLIGRNNSGKSNILRFVNDHYPKVPGLTRSSTWDLRDLEQFRTNKPCRSAITVAVNPDGNKDFGLRTAAENKGYGKQFNTFIEFLRAEWQCGSGFWCDLAFPQTVPDEQVDEVLSAHQGLSNLVHNLCLNVMSSASGNRAENVRRLAGSVLQGLFEVPRCVTIPGLRNPGREEVKEKDFSGADIIHRIAQLQHPQHHQQERKQDFQRIVRFLQRVTDSPSAELEIPYERDTIVVHMNNRAMPLEALGTGIHEVIILAAAATSLHRHVICIEEPEVHLHPLLQKKLLRYLEDETDNQYFISTHSAHLLDHPNAAIFHVRLSDEGSTVASASEPCRRFAICTDLGYRASDLLQTNCIVWVEGPSDRVYVREWLRLIDPNLTEGIDYSIMFYGGRLLSHLSPDDPEVKDFISLRFLNRNMVVVMDSDRDAPGQRLNATKRRIQEAWKEQPGFIWVTKGREIENYVPGASVVEALSAVTGGKRHRRAKTPYEKAISVNAAGKAAADKVRVARWLVEKGKLTLEPLDLLQVIKRLAEFIRASNHELAR